MKQITLFNRMNWRMYWQTTRPKNWFRAGACALSLMAASILFTACNPGAAASAGVNRPKTTATASDGMNPVFQSATSSDANAGVGTNSDFTVGTNSTSGQWVLNFTITDNGRALNFETVQSANALGSATQNYNGRYVYTLDSLCIDDSCQQVIFLVAVTDSSTNKSFQSTYVIYQAGNGFQVAASRIGSSYSYVGEALSDMTYGPSQN